MISTLALLLLSHYDHARSLKPSSLISLYLLGGIIFEIVQVRTLWLFHPISYSLAATVTAALVVRSLLLVLGTSENRETISPQHGRISPENFTGIFSQSTYWWLNGLFISNFRDELSLDDLYPLDDELLTKSLISRGDQQWKEKPTGRLALFRSIIYDVKWTVAAAVAPRLCLIGFKFAQPFLINDLINYVSDNGSKAKAPLYAQFLETTEALATILALHWQQGFADQNAELLNKSQNPFYTMYSIQQWLQVVLDLLMAGLAIVLVTLAIFVSKKTRSGALGVALVNLLSFNAKLASLITNWTQLETSLGAIMRVKQFVTDLQLQPARNEIACPEGWPWEGRVEFRRVSSSYGGHVSTPVLRSVSFSLGGGQKLGICGRTGSGRSSLLACFFSLVTITSGEIFIDGVDISTLPKEKLHSALVPISQNPLTIPGSIRENLALGITSTIDDSAMVSALKEVGLWYQIRDHGGLSANIDTTNLSNGQRQILCIARTILFPGKIIIMDEPTAGFDEHTEGLATELLREKLKGLTIISITHQINTVMDSDLVMAMNHGTVSELGAPQELLNKRDMFWQLYSAKTT
ncbi:hypothetical protein N7536_007280 [Penicillium majusculum]|nr:hypothetical protein N7536_007280 [Penicillium majusculum]